MSIINIINLVYQVTVLSFLIQYANKLWTDLMQEHFTYIEYKGVRIFTKYPHIYPLFHTICKSPKLRRWINSVNRDEIDLRAIEITDANFFGPSNNPDKLGFLKFTTTAFNAKTGKPIDGIVFLRGPCAAILIIVTDEMNNRYVLVGNQMRLPVGNYMSEFIAGMFDEQAGAKVNAVVKKEIKEETGLDLLDNDPNMKSLGNPVVLSGGGSDEMVHLFVWNTTISNEKIEEMKQKEFGERGTNESIRLRFYEYDTFESELNKIGDAKTEVAWYRYNKQIATELSETEPDKTEPAETETTETEPEVEISINPARSSSDEFEHVVSKPSGISWFTTKKNV